MKKSLSLLASTLVLLPHNLALAAPSCDYNPAAMVNVQSQTINIAQQEYTLPTEAKVHIEPTADPELVNLVIVSHSDMSAVQTDFANIITRTGGIPSSSCGDRYFVWGQNLTHEAGSAKGTFAVRYEKWTCTTIRVPCPILRNPGRQCDIGQKNKLGQKTVDVAITMTPTIDQAGNLTVNPVASTTGGSLIDELSFVGGVIGTVLSGPFLGAIGAAVGNFQGTQLARRMSDVQLSAQQENLPEKDLISTTIKASQASFVPYGAGMALQVVSKSQMPVQERSACFARKRMTGIS